MRAFHRAGVLADTGIANANSPRLDIPSVCRYPKHAGNSEFPECNIKHGVCIRRNGRCGILFQADALRYESGMVVVFLGDKFGRHRVDLLSLKSKQQHSPVGPLANGDGLYGPVCGLAG